MGSDNGPSSRPTASLERILMLTFLIIAFTVLISKDEPDVHHHYYGSLGEGQAHHHYGETVTGKTLSSDKKDSSGLRNFPLQPVDDYEDGTTAPSSNGSSGGSSTEAPGSESEDWEEDAPNSESESGDESTTYAPKGSESESGDGSTPAPDESSASASKST